MSTVDQIFTKANGQAVTVTLTVVPNDRFEITSTTGYRAVLPMCRCEGRTPCVKSNCEARGHCHGQFGDKHEEHARVLLAEVAKTYGSAARGKSDPSRGRAHLHRSYAYNGRVREVSVAEWKQGEWFASMDRAIEQVTA